MFNPEIELRNPLILNDLEFAVQALHPTLKPLKSPLFKNGQLNQN